MEEWDPHPRHIPSNPNPTVLPTHQQTISTTQNNTAGPVFEAGTYIVQVPKDQVFRARMHENGRRIPPNPPQLPDTTDRRPICGTCTETMCLYGFIVMLVLTAGISGAIIFLSRNDPILYVASLAFKNPKPGPEFEVRVVVRNPNEYRSIYYDRDSDYKVFLSYKKQDIAIGEFPILDRQAPGNSMQIDLSMHGTSKLPDEIMTKNSTSRIPLTFSIRPGQQSKVSGHVNSKRLRVWCGLVINELDKEPKILWQHCRTK